MFNEERYISRLLYDLTSVLDNEPFEYEVIVVDDCSTDDSLNSVRRFCIERKEVVVVPLLRNQGKGFAVQAGIEICSGKYVLIQDADNEYFPLDIPLLVRSMLNKANPFTVIYGSRYLGAKHFQSGFRKVLHLWPKQNLSSWGFNFLLAFLLFIRHKCWITDLLTGYKLYPTEVFREWTPKTTGFETDHEITLHLISKGYRIIEVPINYEPRSREMGKKIGAIDAFMAVRTLILGRFSS